jgi:hypothetical protein
MSFAHVTIQLSPYLKVSNTWLVHTSVLECLPSISKFLGFSSTENEKR